MPITAVLVLLIETTMIAVGVAYITDYCPSIKQQTKAALPYMRLLRASVSILPLVLPDSDRTWYACFD